MSATVTYDTTAHTLTITGKTNGKALNVSAEVKTAGPDVVNDGSSPRQRAGQKLPQISEVVLADRTPEDASVYTVRIEGVDYSVKVGQDGVSATLDSVLTELGSK